MNAEISTGYFAASGTALAAGRYFNGIEQAPVALITFPFPPYAPCAKSSPPPSPSRNSVIAWVLRYGMRPVVAGLLIGPVSAISIGIAATDPLSLSAVVILLLNTSIIACYLPARRAAGLDPTLALRHD